jgi:hypothetical protein
LETSPILVFQGIHSVADYSTNNRTERQIGFSKAKMAYNSAVNRMEGDGIRFSGLCDRFFSPVGKTMDTQV